MTKKTTQSGPNAKLTCPMAHMHATAHTAVNVTDSLTELYHIAMDKEDHTLAFRVLQTMAKDTDKSIAPLETLSDEELLQLLDAWVPNEELSP